MAYFKAPPRIQHFLLRLQKYQFEVEFSPGKNLVVSDTLTQAPLQDCTSDDKDADAQLHTLFGGLRLSDKKLELLEKGTCNDQTLKVHKEFTLNGWPTIKVCYYTRCKAPSKAKLCFEI